MSVRGFWRASAAKDKKDRSVCTAVPQAPAGRFDPYSLPEGSWRDHPDREAAARAEVAKCSKPKEPRHDG